MKPKYQMQKCALAVALWLITLVVFVPQSKALPTLTNGLVAYWPMDTINSGALTPDLGPNGFDLYPYNNKNIVAFNGANITQALNAGPHAGITGAQNGTNALSLLDSQSTELGYIAPVTTASQLTNLSLPPLNQPNWTLSFWVKADGVSDAGQRIFAMCESPLGNGPNTFWDIAKGGGSGDTPTSPSGIDHFHRQVGQTINGIFFLDDNSGGDHTGSTNVTFDGHWHNLTIVARTITNVPGTAPYIDPTQFGNPANGYVDVAWTSVALDPNNAAHDPNTNQNYQLLRATNPAGPWTSISTQGSAGNGSSGAQIYANFTDTPTNMATFYRVVMPAFIVQSRILYVDGAPLPMVTGGNIDPNMPAGSMPSKPEINGALYRTNGYQFADTFTFGGYLRAAGEGGYTTAQFSDVAVWNRALSVNEIQAFMQDGITNVSGFSAPLFANLSAQFPAAVQGDQDLLSWQAAKPPALLILYPSGANVTPLSSAGLGSTNFTLQSNTVFTLVAAQGASSVTSAPVTVYCVSNVAPNWRYIDSFTYLSDGPIAGQGGWLNPLHGPATATGMGDLEVYTDNAGHNYAGFDGYSTADGGEGAIAGRDLYNLSVVSRATNTLFFRFYISPAATNEDPNYGEIAPINIQPGLSDLGILDVGINGGAGGGPEFTIVQPEGGGPIDLQASSGASEIVTTPGGYSYVDDTVNGNTNGLSAGHIYDVWIDVINNYPGVVGGWGSGNEQTNAALYAVWLQRDDWTARTNLFSAITCTNATGGIVNGTVYPTGYLLSPRDYSANNQNNSNLGPSANLNYMFLLEGAGLSDQSTNVVRLSDFYMSKSGFNATVPVAPGSFKP